MMFTDLAEILAPKIHALLHHWWHRFPPCVLSCWKDAWLAFLPKPNRIPDHPSRLRAIALMEPIGKSLAGLLKVKLQEQVLDELIAWPQFAYIPGRNTGDAIAKVLSHCRLVQHMVSLNKPSVHQRAMNRNQAAICGGLQLSIELSRAFDSISRPMLFGAFRTFQISDDLLVLLQAWRMDCHYRMQSPDGAQPVSIGRGVQQGCKLAPALWALLLSGNQT